MNLWKKNPSIGIILVLLTIGKGGCAYYENEISRKDQEIKDCNAILMKARNDLDTCRENRTLEAKERENYERSISQPYREAAERAVMSAMKKYIEPKMDTIRNL